MPAAFGNQAPKNSWSPRPADMDDGARPNEAKITRFNKYAHQPTWTESRMSCSPDSPARNLDESKEDDEKSFYFSQLGLVFNKTALSDICLSPSLEERYGFFNRPNAYNIVHDLFPVFLKARLAATKTSFILHRGTGQIRWHILRRMIITGKRRRTSSIGVALQQVVSLETEAGDDNTDSCSLRRSTIWTTPRS